MILRKKSSEIQSNKPVEFMKYEKKRGVFKGWIISWTWKKPDFLKQNQQYFVN